MTNFVVHRQSNDARWSPGFSLAFQPNDPLKIAG
jgi:hypothetical protein